MMRVVSGSKRHVFRLRCSFVNEDFNKGCGICRLVGRNEHYRLDHLPRRQIQVRWAGGYYNGKFPGHVPSPLAVINRKSEYPLWGHEKYRETYMIFRVIERLEKLTTTNAAPKEALDGSSEDERTMLQVIASERYRETTKAVLRVLRRFTEPQRQIPVTILHSQRLLSDVADSIIALQHLREWRLQHRSTILNYIAADFSAGRSCFAFFLSFLTMENDWKIVAGGLQKIILVDNDHIVNLTHISAFNARHKEERRPPVEMWHRATVMQPDELVLRMRKLTVPVAITGIQACRKQAPAIVGVFNSIGEDIAKYLCISPCCLPITLTEEGENIEERIIAVPAFETEDERRERIQAAKNVRVIKDIAKRKYCFVCQGKHHVVDCYKKEGIPRPIWNSIVDQAIAKRPCWNCGRRGHRGKECPNPKVQLIEPPQYELDLGPILHARKKWLESQPPSHHGRRQPSIHCEGDNQQCFFREYCELLSQTIQNAKAAEVISTGMMNTNIHEPPTDQESIYVLAHR